MRWLCRLFASIPANSLVPRFIGVSLCRNAITTNKWANYQILLMPAGEGGFMTTFRYAARQHRRAFLFLVGCNSQPPLPKTFTVTGTVNYKGGQAMKGVDSIQPGK